MKKEYHLTITRKDRIYLTLFVIFLLGWELIKPAIPLSAKKDFIVSHPMADEINWQAEEDSMAVYKKSNYEYEHNSFKRTSWESNYKKSNEIAIPPLRMSIMEATVPQLVANGFSKKTAYIIRKYIDAGGVIYNEQGLMKIFSMDSIQLKAAQPYILYPDKPATTFSKTLFTDKKKPAFEIGILDLNETTAEQLDVLPGIGSVLAERIIKYRTSLGGFVRKEQLLECYGIAPETFDQIKDHLTISHSPTYIHINSIDPDSFAHPYLDKRLLRMISSYIKNHGPITSLADLRKVYPPNPEWSEKVIPYVKFD